MISWHMPLMTQVSAVPPLLPGKWGYNTIMPWWLYSTFFQLIIHWPSSHSCGMFWDNSSDNKLTITQVNSYSASQRTYKSRQDLPFQLLTDQCRTNSSKDFHEWFAWCLICATDNFAIVKTEKSVFVCFKLYRIISQMNISDCVQRSS
jgi:hypothetical protein